MANQFGDFLKKAAMSGGNRGAKPVSGGMSGGFRMGGFRGGGMRSGGVRYKKGQTLGGAIAGVFIGLILVVLSPVALWYGESQHTAKDFQSATQTDAGVESTGYIVIEGAPTVDAPLTCVEGAEQCLYYNLQNQELKTIQEEQCGNTTSDARVLYPTVLQCDEDGNNCEQCYMVERDVWQTVSEDTQYTDATVGLYSVEFNASAVMVGLEDQTITHSETERDVWSYFPVPGTLLVAGDAGNLEIRGASATYVLSPYSYEVTLGELEQRDATNKWMLRIVSFVMLFIGFSLILGPISYFSHVMRKVPLVGPLLKAGGGLLVGIAAALLAVVTWVVLFILITLIKNIVITVVLLVAVLGLFLYAAKKNKAENGGEAPNPPATPANSTPAV